MNGGRGGEVYPHTSTERKRAWRVVFWVGSDPFPPNSFVPPARVSVSVVLGVNCGAEGCSVGSLCCRRFIYMCTEILHLVAVTSCKG